MNGITTAGMSLMIGGIMGVADSVADSVALGSVGNAIEEIIVTATKRESGLQDTPLRVDVFDSRYLARANIREFSQLSDALPNLMAPDGVTGTQNVAIRGISSPARGFGIEQPVGVYVDGVFGPPGSLDQYLLDMARVEIIRGPQGVVWGRNSLAGAISYTTERPTEEFSGFLRGEVGNKSLRNLGLVVSGPLAGDLVSGRLALAHVERDGFSRRLSGGTFGDEEQDTLRGSLRLRPGAATIDLVVDHAKVDYHSAVPEYFSGEFAQIAGTDGYDRVQDTDFYEPSTNRSHGVTLLGSFPFGNLALDSITGYRAIDRNQVLDSDGTARFFVNEFVESEARQWSQELRLSNGAASDLRWMAGLYLYRREDDISAGSEVSGEVFPLPPGANISESIAQDQETRNAAVFVTAEYDFAPQLTLNSGLRLEREDKKQFSSLTSVAVLPDGTVIPLAMPDVADQSGENSPVSPLLGLSWRPGETALLYAGWGRGHKSGGFNSPRASVDEFDAERADSFELGLKSSWLGERLTVNATAFHIDYRDMQVRGLEATSTGVVQIFRNAGAMTSRGLELELSAGVKDNWQVGVSLGYNDAEFDQFIIPGPAGDTDLSGNKPAFAPEFSAATFARLEIPLRDGFAGYLQGEWNYTGDYFLDFNNIPDAGEQDAYSILNFRAGVITAGGLEFALWGRNLGDEDYKVDFVGDLPPVIFGSSQAHLLAPGRTYGVELSKSF